MISTELKNKLKSLYGLDLTKSEVFHNLSVEEYYTHATQYEIGSVIAKNRALVVSSGQKTGRSPKDKRIVLDQETKDRVWWGDVNKPISPENFQEVKNVAIDFLSNQERIYVVDGLAGWDPTYQLKIRVITTRAYHALFMYNMLIRPLPKELQDFDCPDYTIFNAGETKITKKIQQVDSDTSVSLNFTSKEMIIVGTQYAGEMKKGVFTIMNYLMPKKDILSMHCSANIGKDNKSTLFFGLSGTGKTTLSADSERQLIGDDEHCWSDKGIFNIEGGCYAKCINLDPKKEPEIYKAIKFGSVLENVVVDLETLEVDYNDTSITENTRCSYPIEYIENIDIPCVGPSPSQIVFLTCDAFGILPPVSKLTKDQAMYHFINGYTAKIAGTEMGIDGAEATFSSCFGEAFMVWHPQVYAKLLASKMEKHKANVWLVNTGWIGGQYGVGKRIDLSITRSIVNAINRGQLDQVETRKLTFLDLHIPTSCPEVPTGLLDPQSLWEDKEAFNKMALKLTDRFEKNYQKYSESNLSSPTGHLHKLRYSPNI